jgi:hypothetical protein
MPRAAPLQSGKAYRREAVIVMSSSVMTMLSTA